MKTPWLVVLAPRAEIPEFHPLESVRPAPRGKVAKAVEGLAGLAPFDADEDEVRFVPMAEDANPLDVARAAVALAAEFGPVTLVDPDFTVHVEVVARTPPDRVVAELAEACRRREEQARAAFVRPPRVSPDPPPFAPGRPEKGALPPIRTTLTAALVLVGGWYLVKPDFTGCRRSELVLSPSPKAPAEVTAAAFSYAHALVMSLGEDVITPEGWVENRLFKGPASPAPPQAKEGKVFVCDGWENPIRCSRLRTGFRYASFGPNGRDDGGRGDDLVEVRKTRP